MKGYLRTYRVGVFRHDSETPGRKPRYAAYTTWYSPEWKGCVEVVVEAESGAEAKRKAIADVKRGLGWSRFDPPENEE